LSIIIVCLLWKRYTRHPFMDLMIAISRRDLPETMRRRYHSVLHSFLRKMLPNWSEIGIFQK